MLDGYTVESLHTSGHASKECIREFIAQTKPDFIIPMHSECSDEMGKLCEFSEYIGKIKVLHDQELFAVG